MHLIALGSELSYAVNRNFSLINTFKQKQDYMYNAELVLTFHSSHVYSINHKNKTVNKLFSKAF